MVQGTASHAGKSTLVAALCRLCAQAGYRVAPFKAQNMSNNAAVTDDGGEVGRAQAMQAMAAGIPVTVDMNPILLKPQSDRTSQVVVLGKVHHVSNAREYYDRTSELWPIVTGALDRLRSSFDVVVIEGAGSPAEINLARYDLVNMRVARYANAPVLLVGDIDRGGVFASLYGTVALLQPEERALIRGFVINKFRGDPSLLTPGFGMLEERTGVPTLGVLPYLDLSRIPAEDAVEWGSAHRNENTSAPSVDIAVLRLPRIANVDEFQPLACEAGVQLRFIGNAEELGTPDLIIIPGTKSTFADLEWLRSRGLEMAICARRDAGVPIWGICGGFQMLGTHLIDEHGAERRGEMDGLGLLPVTTTFAAEKITRKVTAYVTGETKVWNAQDAIRESDAESHPSTRSLSDIALDVYEIHMGRSTSNAGATLGPPPFQLSSSEHRVADGASSTDGLVFGTYLHGLLENHTLRRSLLARLAARKGISLPEADHIMQDAGTALDTLATTVRTHLDLSAIAEMTGLPRLADLGKAQ